MRDMADANPRYSVRGVRTAPDLQALMSDEERGSTRCKASVDGESSPRNRMLMELERSEMDGGSCWMDKLW